MDASLPFPWFDAAIILVLIAVNGVFAMSELAIVSSRPAKLNAMADGGKRGRSQSLGQFRQAARDRLSCGLKGPC